MDTNLDGSQDTTASGGPQEDMSEPKETDSKVLCYNDPHKPKSPYDYLTSSSDEEIISSGNPCYAEVPKSKAHQHRVKILLEKALRKSNINNQPSSGQTNIEGIQNLQEAISGCLSVGWKTNLNEVIDPKSQRHNSPEAQTTTGKQDEGSSQATAFQDVIRNLQETKALCCTKDRIFGGKFEIDSDTDFSDMPPLVEMTKKKKEDSELDSEENN